MFRGRDVIVFQTAVIVIIFEMAGIVDVITFHKHRIALASLTRSRRLPTESKPFDILVLSREDLTSVAAQLVASAKCSCCLALARGDLYELIRKKLRGELDSIPSI